MESIVKIIEALAWPVTAVIMSIMFKGEFGTLLGRVNKVKFKEFQADLEQGLKQAEKDVQAVPEPKSSNGKNNQSKTDDSSVEKLIRIAIVSPRAAITEAWVELEKSIRTISIEKDIDPRESDRKRGVMPSHRMVTELVNQGHMPESLLPLFEDLRLLRNKVAHRHDFEVDYVQSEKYIYLIRHFQSKLMGFAASDK
jgi:uncharacterized protein YutE (UPF0331/DUF86 family)